MVTRLHSEIVKPPFSSFILVNYLQGEEESRVSAGASLASGRMRMSAIKDVHEEGTYL